MTAHQASDTGPYEVIHLGGEVAAIVPLGDLRHLQAVQRRALPELLEEAEVEATLVAHREWLAAGGRLARGSDGRVASQAVRIEWSPAARASARRFMEDQDAMRAIGAAVARLP